MYNDILEHTLLNTTNSITLYKKHLLSKNNENKNPPKRTWYNYFIECFY
jgi:hypothetical protein